MKITNEIIDKHGIEPDEFKKIIWAFNKVKCDIRVYIAAKKDEEKESTEYIWNYYG